MDPRRGIVRLFFAQKPNKPLYSQVVTGHPGTVQNKTLAMLIRGGGRSHILAKSGWSPSLDQQGDFYPLVRGSEYTEKAWRLCRTLGCRLRHTGIDARGKPGYFEVSHAEMQLIAWLVEEHFPGLGSNPPRSFNRSPFDEVLIISNRMPYPCCSTLANMASDRTGITIKIECRGAR